MGNMKKEAQQKDEMKKTMDEKKNEYKNMQKIER